MYIVFAIKNAQQGVQTSAGTIVITVLSCIFLAIIVVIGVLAVIRKSRTLCLYVRLSRGARLPA